MGQLSKPILNVSLERHGNKHYKVGVASMQGYRLDMEDTFALALSLPSNEEMSVFGVFDGHGGSPAAKFCERHFVDHIDRIQSFSRDEIENALLLLDSSFLSEQEESGCTATFSIVKHVEKSPELAKYVTAIGNLGDSRTILVRKSGEIAYCTRDHRPDDLLEKLRILRAKGVVFRHRVGGCLALSRAIGDREFKLNSFLPPDKQQVIARPDIFFFPALEGDMLILACDGLFEYLPQRELVEYLVEELERKDDIAEVLRELLMKCVEGSGDNMTIMVIQFKDGTDYEKGKEFIKGPSLLPVDDEFAKAYEKNVNRFSLL